MQSKKLATTSALATARKILKGNSIMWIVTPAGNLVNTDHVVVILHGYNDEDGVWEVKARCSHIEVSALLFSGDQDSCVQFLETLSKQMESNTSGFISTRDISNE